MTRYAACWLVVLVLVGCPGAGDTAEVGVCTKLHEQCRLREGLLGVCNAVACGKGQSGPCLECVSQH